MGIWKKIGIGISILCAAIAGIAAVKLTGPSPVSAPVGGISFSWLPTLLTALGLGTTTSLPVLIPKLVDLFKRYVLPLLPASVGGAKIGGVIDGAQIAAYLLLISKAKTDDERAALLIAGRASCDAFRDELFPVPAFPVPAVKVSA